LLLQLAQLVAAQVVQGLEASADVSSIPSEFLEEKAKAEKIRLTLFLHCGHGAFSLASSRGRSNSNLELQSGQKYS